MASMLIPAATAILTTVGVPAGVALPVATIGVNLALSAATTYIGDAMIDAPRVEGGAGAFRADPEAKT